MPSTNDSSDCRESRYETTFDPAAGDRASEVVVTAVGTVTGSDPVNLEPLYDAIEPDALDSLCDHAGRKRTETHRLRFSYAGFDVDVRTDGRVRVLEPSSGSEVAANGE
ncbi:HalOD1 output domain-containing protein [Natronococcus wangiae]|uniref:HalOD1 output domain-containing protein n=1 Tax=Natronococcus wangiae TaxID=3068275 RepID=UPI00273E7B52|nr:HalOD1 output domain-containing protein [Natronococcus sp. AD5]